MMTGLRSRVVLASLLVSLVGLTGCSQPTSDMTSAAAEQLQEAVDSVVQATAEGRYDSATAELARTRTLLDEAADAGQLSVSRYRMIDDALRRTEAELATVIAAVDAPAPEEEQQVADVSGGSGGGGSGSGEKSPPAHSNAGGNDK